MEFELGRGAYGHVSCMKHKPTSTMMAVKVSIERMYPRTAVCLRSYTTSEKLYFFTEDKGYS